MELDNRRLGWIAVGLGVLSLFLAISGRADSRHTPYMMGYGPQSRYVAPAAPEVAPQAPQAPPMYHDGWQGQGRGDWGHGRGMMFFGPFIFLGGLLKLLFFGGLFFLALRFLRGRRHGPWGRGPGQGSWGGGPGSGNGEDERSEPRDPPAEPGASTGSTVKL